MSIPLIIGGTAVGILNLSSDNANGTFTPEQRRILANVGNQVSDALERARLLERLEQQVEDRTRQLNSEVVVRRKAERAAETANQRLLDAIDCMNDGFALYDADDNLVIHNRRYRDMHAPKDDLITESGNFDDMLRAGFCSNGSKPTEDEIAQSLRVHRDADGRPFIQKRGSTWYMLREHRTEEGGVVVIETDITDIKKAEIAKDDFLAMVSHELRTPLTPIHGALSLISSGKVAEMTKNLSELTDLARRNCDRMMAIVNDLLDLSRIASGRFSLNMKEINITPYLVDIVENKRIGSDTPDVTLKVSPAAKTATTNADPLRIQQVLDNLLSNAIKFTDPGDRIEVNIGRKNGTLHVSVADHGPGIPKEFQSKVFDAFAQADSSSTRQKGGVGLGLSISKSIIEAHGGKIGLSSKQGKGTTFYFDLPVGARKQSAPAESSSKAIY